MSVPVNPFMWILSALPIVVLILLMIKFRWGALKASAVGLAITLISSFCFFRANLELIAVESTKGIWNAFVIIIIVWTALLLYHVGNEANAFNVIRDGMRKLLPNELLLVLAMGWVFESFLQGITGFGVPVAVGAPLLIGIGVQPLWAVIIPLLGQSWGNTFGTLAAAWDSLAMSVGINVGSALYSSTALWTALFIFIWDAIVGFLICWFYGKGKAVRKGLPAVLILVLIQGGGELLLSQVNTTLSCFIPSIISLAAVLLLGKLKTYSTPWCIPNSKIMTGIRSETDTEESRESSSGKKMTLMQAFLPYFLLSALTVVVLAVKPIYNFLSIFKFGFAFPEVSTGYGYINEASACYSPIAPFTHASMFLFISAMAGLLFYKKNGWIKDGSVAKVFNSSTLMTLPSGLAVLVLIVLSRIMGGTGQTAVLASGIAKVLGKAYLIFAPFVGLLGTFMTGSNMSSNILFGPFQMTTGALLNVDLASLLGGQSVGGAIGSAISPSKIILGTTTANIAGKEGEVMKKILPITMVSSLVIGLFDFLKALI